MAQEPGTDTQEIEERLAAFREPLTALPEAVLAQDGEEIYPYSSGSLAMEEAVATSDEAVREVLLRARLPILAAGDHLKALDRLLTPLVLTASPWTVARTILESTARASWLLVPDVLAKERVARCLVLKYQEGRELPKRGRAVKHPSNLDDVERIPEWTQMLISKKAKDLEIPLKLGKKDGLARIGGTPTGVTSTDIIRGEYDEELYYRVLSGAEHQELWALDFFSGGDVSDSGGHLREFTMREEQYGSLVKCAVWWYAIAVWRYFNYLGYDLDRLEAVLSEAGRPGELPAQYWRKLRPHPED